MPKANEVILGVDTHLDLNVGALISGIGRFLGIFSIETVIIGFFLRLVFG